MTSAVRTLQRLVWYWQHKKKEAAKREAAGEEPEPDAEFDGGFKVPGDVFSRLFDYQKTGWTSPHPCQARRDKHTFHQRFLSILCIRLIQNDKIPCCAAMDSMSPVPAMPCGYGVQA